MVVDTLIDLIFPKLCVGCKKSGSLICDQCWLTIDFIYQQICPICQEPSIGGLTHAGCQAPQGLDSLTVLVYFRGPIRPLIHQLKYQGVTLNRQLIDQLFSQYLAHESFYFTPAIIVPIPLHSKSLNSRGFNQAAIIATILSQQTGFPIVDSLLHRHQGVTSQTKLSRLERQHTT